MGDYSSGPFYHNALRAAIFRTHMVGYYYQPERLVWPRQPVQRRKSSHNLASSLHPLGTVRQSDLTAGEKQEIVPLSTSFVPVSVLL